jgi:hypothetical protein
MNFKQVYEGWRNHLVPPKHLKKAIKIVSMERMSLCSACEFNSKNRKEHFLRIDEHCTDCGCTLSAKTKCLSCCCTMGYWNAVLSQEEEDLL